MPRFIDVLLNRHVDEPDVPNCPVHHIEMHLRGKQGRPTRFSDQMQEEYTLIYFCPEHECDETKSVLHVKSQIPVPGESPDRPYYSRRD